MQDFADRAQLYWHYAASLERAERNPPLETFYRVASALDVSVADLLPPAPNAARWGRLIYCPGCDLSESTIRRAYQHDQPCPECGLPAALIQQVLAARRRTVGPYE